MNRVAKALFYSNNKFDSLQAFFFTVTVGFLLIVLWGGYLLLLEDNPPMVINDVEVLTPEVTPGDQFRIRIDFCKSTNARGETYVAWLNGTVTFQVPIPMKSPEGCYVSVFSSEVPHSLIPGEYMRLTELIYDVNALTQRTVSYELPGIVVLPVDEGE